MPKTARELALDIIYKVHKDKIYANHLLPEALRTKDLSSQDKFFVTELVCGALRMEGSIDWVLSNFSSKEMNKIPPKALDILRLGTYQLLYLDRVPSRAAVDESVKIAKKNFHQGIANFVNGILREISRNKSEIKFPKKDNEPVAHISLKHSHPEWLVRRWINEFGVEETEKLCMANNIRPQVKLRTNLLKITPRQLANMLNKRGVTTSQSTLLNEALIVDEAANLTDTMEFKNGLFFIQDESSMMVSHIVNPQPGETVLDTCSSPGGKTTHLAEMMRNKGLIIAVDKQPMRLKLLEKSCARMGVEIVAIAQADATKLNEILSKPVDKVLVDAPCSGLGVLARKPDARWRKTPEQIVKLAKLQQNLLSSAKQFVKIGGRLVYSVCTISKEETLDIVDFFLDNSGEFELEDIGDRLSVQFGEKKKWVQLLPHKHKTDGMFIASFVRVGG
ncbi:MAG TPA: 16S rRNA (cytosine(967)-C(5))-methyltransferase RsmB [Actinobacteria bacterium]|nr:16S rRNA (cytosine(967)-C(5))-methyltransferase RsmB [Actinomycetota bacterium]